MIRSLFTSAMAAVLSLAALACSDRDSYYYPQNQYGDTYYPSTTAQPTTPILALVDTDQTIEATPGTGVGVFVEYHSGGHWNIRWTCDTSKSGEPCNFNVKVESANPITNALENENPAATDTTSSSYRVYAGGTITNSMSTLTFDTTAGEDITLTANVAGLDDNAFIFFVQDGKINGGFDRKLTNPIRLVGTSP